MSNDPEEAAVGEETGGETTVEAKEGGEEEETETERENYDTPEQVRPPTKWQRYYGWFVFDVLLYIVVLNLSAELVDNIVMERFSITIFVAVVLKLVLGAIQYLEHLLQDFFCVKLERKCLGAFVMWLVVFSSKFLFLWIDDVIFGDMVELGYIWEIIVLSFVLVVLEKLNRILYRKLGDWNQPKVEEDGVET